VQDQGIGPYEFWGATGTDHDWRFVSPCCEADMVDSGGSRIGPPCDSIDDEADHAYNQKREEELFAGETA
jgi:hypothetical protein